MVNKNCVCPRKSCEHHGDCPACREFHKDTKVLSFCLWQKKTGCQSPKEKGVVRAWLSGNIEMWANNNR